jgi:hypothetical protein
MSSDLSAETGPLEPGVDQLFQTLTAGPDPAELAGEHDALAMFRAHARPPASPARASRGAFRGGALRGGASRGASRGTGRGSAIRRLRWGTRLAAAVTAVVIGGTAAAAYASALPSPVQRLAHDVFHVIGVPPAQHDKRAASGISGRRGSGSSHSGAPGHHGSSPTAPVSPSRHPSASTSPSSSPSAAAGPLTLTATAASSPIPAGTAATIDGRLTSSSGKGVAGVTVTLLERAAKATTWAPAGTARTTAAGNVVVISSAPLTTNAAFQLAAAGAQASPIVIVTVTPVVTATLQPDGAHDVLVVSTKYAYPGNIVVLQIQTASGSWLFLRDKPLNANATARFVLVVSRLQGRTLRVKLVATIRHGRAVSNPVTVPAGHM